MNRFVFALKVLLSGRAPRAGDGMCAIPLDGVGRHSEVDYYRKNAARLDKLALAAMRERAVYAKRESKAQAVIQSLRGQLVAQRKAFERREADRVGLQVTARLVEEANARAAQAEEKAASLERSLDGHIDALKRAVAGENARRDEAERLRRELEQSLVERRQLQQAVTDLTERLGRATKSLADTTDRLAEAISQRDAAVALLNEHPGA